MKNNLFSIQGKSPILAEDVAIFTGARIIGAVSMAAGSSVWYNAVLRADLAEIKIGEYSNIQDGCVLHNDTEHPCIVGKYVTVGHKAILHGCVVGDYALIGMNSCILNGAEIGEGAIIGAGAVVTAGTKIPPYSVAVGSPAKVIKTLEASSKEDRQAQAVKYFHMAQEQKKDIMG
ncbi:MAG: gamma carbonic anhydrase family protein [Peptococcia bacterium]